MNDLEHPLVTTVNRTGYSVPEPKHWGFDIIGDEIYEGDDIIELPNGEILLEENLEDYLIEHLNFKFFKAK